MRAFAGNDVEDYYEHSMRDFPLPARMFYAAAVGVTAGLSKLLWRWGIEDADRYFWNDKRGRVLIMNHGSMIDPVVIAASAYAHGLRVRPIYKSEFDKSKIVRWAFSRVGAIPVVRGTADIKAVRRAQRAIKRGECVLVFPEGTRIKDDGPHEIHKGFALMAQMAKAPVQPFAIVGSRDITPPGKVLKRLHTVFAAAGPCIEFSDLDVKGRKQQIERMEELAMDEVWKLRDGLRTRHPGRM